MRLSLTKRVARFLLGWSHYVTLLFVDSADERRLCEIEAAGNGWAVRELKRQSIFSMYTSRRTVGSPHAFVAGRTTSR